MAISNIYHFLLEQEENIRLIPDLAARLSSLESDVYGPEAELPVDEVARPEVVFEEDEADVVDVVELLS